MGCIGIWVGAPSSHTCVSVESTCARVDNGRGAWQVRYFVRMRSTRAGSLAVWQSGSAVEMWYGVSSLTVAAMMFDSVLDAVVNSRRGLRATSQMPATVGLKAVDTRVNSGSGSGSGLSA